MNFLWEVVLACKEAGSNVNNIQFTHTTQGSPYMELSLECLNQDDLSTIREIDVNTYYRFYQIFKDMFQPELKEYPALRSSLTNLILHMLADNDVRKGMTKEEYSKRMLFKNIIGSCYGSEIRTAFDLFNREQQEILLSGWLRCYRAGSSLTIFTDMIHMLIEDSIVYHVKESPREILIYTGLKKTWETETRLSMLQDVFLEIRYVVEVFYEYHFGILGIPDTMLIGEIAMY